MLKQNERGNRAEDKKMAKKTYTFDYKGDLLFVNNLRTDGLPQPLVNPPFKIKDFKLNGIGARNGTALTVPQSLHNSFESHDKSR